ncbi:MAG: sigma-70 family RNA polymerase sigma factor, partial [Gammaproteobacteria bacterium]
QERVGEVGEALAALPEKYRIPLVLAYYQEAGYDEIAAALGITRNHVGVLILRAKQALRRRLAETGHDASRNSRLARGADRALQGDPS